MATDIVEELRACAEPLLNCAADEIEKLRALLVDIDKSDLLEHRSECRRHMWNDEKCSCDFNALQERINAATAAKEEPK